MPDINLEGDHPRIISAKFGWDWLSSFRGEDFFLISSPLFSIFSLVAILVGSRDHWTQFWKGAIQGIFHQNLVAIGPVVSEEKIFMWIFHTYFWKRTIQWLFHQHLVLIEQMVLDKKIFMGISHRVPCKIKFGCGSHLGRRYEMSNTILEGDHQRIISAKFGWDWLSSFRGEDSFKISSPLFSIFSLVAILVGSRDHQTQFWKGVIQGSSTKVWLRLAQ